MRSRFGSGLFERDKEGMLTFRQKSHRKPLNGGDALDQELNKRPTNAASPPAPPLSPSPPPPPPSLKRPTNCKTFSSPNGSEETAKTCDRKLSILSQSAIHTLSFSTMERNKGNALGEFIDNAPIIPIRNDP